MFCTQVRRLSLHEPSPSSSRRQSLSSDAVLGLERLVVGRECNAFDQLSVERKARAYAELIEAGFVCGTVKAKVGQSYPEVVIQRVSTRGKRAMQAARPKPRSDKSVPVSSSSSGGTSWKIALFFIVFAAVLLLALMIMGQSASRAAANP